MTDDSDKEFASFMRTYRIKASLKFMAFLILFLLMAGALIFGSSYVIDQGIDWLY